MITMVQDVVINGRYQLHESLGQGGMGIVYRATDRLTGNIVALKQVLIESSQLRFSGQTEKSYRDGLQIALAKEFQLLASLRHPYIVSVLDYGFDANSPYIVMDYLADAQTVLEAGVQQPFLTRLTFLQQLLQAVAYLHRRNVLHHDLKPQNILVSHGDVRILDFGLASSDTVRGSSSGGTPFYSAPEVWEGVSYTRESELFAVGIVAYELLAGVHPFAPLDHAYLERLLEQDPDFTLLNAPPAIVQLISKLLAKEPENRYQHALVALQDLNRAMPAPEVTDSVAIRESYLQAATFVGREREVEQLQQALTEAGDGHGSLWLIGGESGVGKSRLLNELQTSALVAGFQVLQGQAIREGGTPYQMWRDLVGHMALQTPLSQLEASVLKEIQPRLPMIRNEIISDPPHLEGRAQQERLIYTLSEVLQRQDRPTLLLLEDLQWAHESLEPLRLLAPHLFQLPMLVVGSYRIDESPDLPAQFVESTHQIVLSRFGHERVTQLATMILGKGGTHPELVEQLIQQTEGNVFFLVETLRAWAEEVGGLQEVGKTAVLPQVLTGGMAQIIRHRLAKVPEAYHPLLKLMAIAGRQLDEQLLKFVAGDINVQTWLLACNEAMVLTVEANRWQFAHDKLRETLLQDLTGTEKQEGHYRVAEALETLYGESEDFAITLAEHWRQAGNASKQIPYAIRASKHLLWIGQYSQADSLIQQLLVEQAELLTVPVEIELHYMLGSAYRHRSYHQKSIESHRVGLMLARKVGAERAIMQHLIGSAWSTWLYVVNTKGLARNEYFTVAEADLLEAFQLAEGLSDLRGMGHSLHNLAIIFQFRDSVEKALTYMQRALVLFQEADDPEGISISYNDIGLALTLLEQLEEAKAYFLKSVALMKTSGNPLAYPHTLSALTRIAISQLDWEEVADYIAELLTLRLEPQHSYYNSKYRYAAILAFHQRDYTVAIAHINVITIDKQSGKEAALFDWGLRGVLAVMEADSTTLQLCLDKSTLNTKKNLTPEVMYIIILCACYYMLIDEIERGATWLALARDYFATLDEHKFYDYRGAAIDIFDSLSDHFQGVLAAPAAQAGEQRAAQFKLATIIQGWDEKDELDAEQVMKLVNGALFGDV